MIYYQEVQLHEEEDIAIPFLWEKLFERLHHAFVKRTKENENRSYGVSFPEYRQKFMGSQLRIFGEKEDLEILDIKGVLRNMTDYIHIGGIRPVPERQIKGYAVYQRYQPDSTVERKARRYIKRHEGITYEEACHLLTQKERKNGCPYIKMHSTSTGQSFSLFIEKKEKEENYKGNYNTYGLSHERTVPEF